MKVAILGAGGPAGVNTCKALADHDVIAVDEVREHLTWAAPYAKLRWLPIISAETVNDLEADVVIPQPDSLTLWLADQREVHAATFLPDRRTIALCQDKYEAALQWRRSGLRNDRVELVDAPVGLPKRGYPLWFRARHGAGAKGAILARSLREAKHWYGFWHGRGVVEFITEAYLPGRDFAWSSLWYEGNLVTSFLRERLEYIYPHLTPEGLTGTPSRARIVHDREANAAAMSAVLAVDEKPHGIFSVDMREDTDGVPRPTEINAGRGFTTFGLWALLASPNLMERVVRFAMKDDSWRADPFDCIPEGTELRRHIDCGSTVYRPVKAAA